MIIKLSPCAPTPEALYALVVEVSGDSLTINNEVFDFAQLPEGATLPAAAINSDYFTGPVERINGELQLTLRLPHGANPPQHVAFPEPIRVAQDGPVKLPTDEVDNVD